MASRFFVADWCGRRFLHEALDGSAPVLAVLRDAGTERIWGGTVHPDRASADVEAERAPGTFEGPVVAVVGLREIGPEEAEDLGAEVSSNPDLFREVHRSNAEMRRKSAEATAAAISSGPRR